MTCNVQCVDCGCWRHDGHATDDSACRHGCPRFVFPDDSKPTVATLEPIEKRLRARYEEMAGKARALGFAPEADAELFREAAEYIEGVNANHDWFRKMTDDYNSREHHQ